MEYQKVIYLLYNTPDQPSTFRANVELITPIVKLDLEIRF